MGAADIVGRESSYEWDVLRGCFHCGATVVFLSFDEAEHGDNVHVCFAGSLDCGDS